MSEVSDAIVYEPGATLTDLAVDRRHRVRLQGWGLVKMMIHAGPPVHVPEPVPPMMPDDEDWQLERLEISSR